MADWSSDLGAALAAGDPQYMKAMLARVPQDVLQMAIPYLDQLAKASEKDGKLEQSLAYHDQLIEATAGHVDRHAARARVYLKLDRFAQALADANRISELAPECAVGYRLQAEACDALGELPRALAACHQVLRLEPDDAATKQRIRSLETDLRKEALPRQTLDPDAAQESLHIELPPPPQVVFDPALFDDPSIAPSFDAFRVEGLKQHLWRYSGQLSPRNAITRLEDPVWLAAWDAALSTTTGAQVMFRGSELGVFALRALHHGAAHALCVEAFALDARIATGVVQKHFLAPWYARHGAAIQGWSEEERRASFDEFASAIDIVPVGSQPSSEAQPGLGRCDCLVFPQIDHTLLGTGIVKAVRQYCAGERAAPARVLPAKATVFAMGVQWAYPGAQFQLEPLNRLRWSLYPQALDLGPEFWTALTAPVRVGEIDFANFSEATWDIALPVTAHGTVDAIVYWFELDLGNARISNAPGGALRCIKPAIQYTDEIEVQVGNVLHARARVEESRLYFHTLPPAALQRRHGLPSWYVPMLGDRRRNEAYRSAIAAALATMPGQVVLDIGAGCGLLSMMAAHAGAKCVVGCETSPAILTAGKEIVALNGLGDTIALVGKDCRNMTVPDDLPRRADLALFELFDCSLIGEGILHFLPYAREHLLAHNARYLPAAARIRAIVIEYRLDEIWDIDANLLNPYRASPSFINVDAVKLDYRALTEPFDVFAFDFASAGPAPDEKELRLVTTMPGTAGAVLFWFDLGLDETCWISNDPHGENAMHWKQGLQFLPEVRVDAGGQLPLIARHDGSGLKFQWQQDALPKEAFSKLPRYDPRALAASSELEQETSALMQHCLQNRDEYAKVAEIAKRFAIDPAAHDLDPTIAQRFASMFFGT
jgi:type III protein arginine methyltransferase